MCRQGSVLGVLGVLGVWSLANGRLEGPNKRGLCAGKGQAAMLERWRPGAWWKLPRGMCRQRAGCNPGAAKADGQAWWKLGLCAGKGPPPTSSATIAQIWAPIWVQDMPAKCCPAACTFKARAEGLAQVKPAQAPLRVWCPHGRQRTGPAVCIRSMTWTATTGMRERLLWPWKTKPSAGRLTCPKHIIFMSKCLEVLTGGWRMPGGYVQARERFRRFRSFRGFRGFRGLKPGKRQARRP